MKKDQQKTVQEHARQGRRARKVLQLDKETLRVMNGGSPGPVLSPSWRPSQCPTLCF